MSRTFACTPVQNYSSGDMKALPKCYIHVCVRDSATNVNTKLQSTEREYINELFRK